MTHLSRELVESVVEGQAGEAEVERLVEHVLACATCRSFVASAFAAAGRGATKTAGTLPALLQVADERDRAVETLSAIAEWSAVRQLGPKAQKDRVVRARACHSRSFVNVALAELRLAGGEEAELIAALAFLAINRMDEGKLGQLREDLRAQVWIEVGNARRRGAHWRSAETALSHAERLVRRGDPLVEARFLSVKASLLSDNGHGADAVAILQRCKALYAEIEDWPLVARTLVKEANVLAEVEPERALEAISQALPNIRGEDVLLHARILQAECFIETNRLPSALRVFLHSEPLWAVNPRPRIQLRGKFLGGQLLEALGRYQEAMSLFEEVVAGDLSHGLYKDAFLDLLYLFGVCVRCGNLEGATSVCHRALGQLEGLNLVHEQLSVVWAQLLEAARAGALDDQALGEVKAYLRVFWRQPARQTPKLTCIAIDRVIVGKVEESLSALLQEADSECVRAVEALLATAEWSALKRLSRRDQHERVGKSIACHSLAFVNVLLRELRLAGGEEAEFIASITLQAVDQMDEAKYGQQREDLKAQVWIELGNSRRRVAWWRRAEAALAQAERFLAKGTGDPLAEARFLSIKASLLADQGHRSAAVAILQRCKARYAEVGELPLVARTLVKAANVLAEIEPERALETVAQALPHIPEGDVFLHAENLRAECFIATDRLSSALRVFLQTEPLWAASPRPRSQLRGKFLGGQLLEALDRPREAAKLFEGVIAGDLHYELYKDAFLDMLYLFGVHVRSDAPERAVEVCGRALSQLKALGLVHEQLSTLWDQLFEAALLRTLDIQVLAEVEAYLQVSWKHPAPTAPRLI